MIEICFENDHWMSSRMTIYHTWAEALCEGVSEDSSTWYIASGISFHGMTCRIPYRIGMFLLECDCEMLSKHCMCT